MTREAEEAMANGEDTTGLQTVREWTAQVMENEPITQSDWLVFEHNGCRWRVQLVICECALTPLTAM